MYVRLKSKTCTTSILNVLSIVEGEDHSITIRVDGDVYTHQLLQNLNNMGMTITEIKVIKKRLFRKSIVLYKKINIKGYKELLIRK